MRITTPRARQPRILYLAFFFPPSRASGVYRARATANHLARSGWDVTVHTAPREFFTRYIGSVDASLEQSIEPGIRVERPKMGYYRWERDIRRYGRFRANMPVLANAGMNWLQRHFFPEHYGSWIPRVVSRALRAHLRRRYDLILATGNPFSAFAAAWYLHKITGVPYALDYRDSWTLDLFAEQDKFPPGHPARQWESRVLKDASLAVFVNENLRAWHADRYPAVAARTAVVANGWEPELLGEAQFPGPVRDRPLRFGYIGTLTEMQPLTELFEGWRIARAHPDLADATLDLYGHLGFFSQAADALRARIPSDPESGVNYRGPVEKTQIAQAYRDIDVLVFAAAGSRYVTSGKVFEYMATGKPIVSVHSPGIAAAEVLDGHPLWFGIDKLDAQSVGNAMVAAAKAARDLTEKDFDHAIAHADGYTRDATLGPFEARLRQIAQDPKGKKAAAEARTAASHE